jgi:arylsulfatase A-like enzyme
MTPTSHRRPPNLLVFFTDQQRPDSIGCYGQPLPTTPHLDRMAAKGVRFERAYTPNPLCGPARASLQTGRYPTATGNHVNNIRLPEQAVTVAKLLSNAGYACGYLGKWHLASAGPKGGPDSFRTSAVPRALRGGYSDYWLAADALEWTSHGYGGFLFDGDDRRVEFDENTHRVDFMTDHLLRAVDSLAAGTRPFFLTASYLEPHHQNDRDAYEPPHGTAEAFQTASIPGDLAALKGNWPRHYANYLACVAALDRGLGRVLHRLDELGIADNTLVVFVSDHGCHFATRNSEYKRSCHDASIHIPLVLRGPGFTGGRVDPAMASLLDVPATLLRAAGVPIPADWHGRPLQESGAKDWRNEHLIQLSESQVGRALRTDRWTYSVRAPGPFPRGDMAPMQAPEYVEDFLYDNAADPHQLQNLVTSPEHEEIRSELRDRLLNALAVAGEPAAIIRPAAP